MEKLQVRILLPPLRPQDRVKLFAPPLLWMELFVPHFSMAKTSSSYVKLKLPQNCLCPLQNG